MCRVPFFGWVALSCFIISTPLVMSPATPVQPTKLNSIQVSLLRLFERGMSEEETLELKRLMVKSYLEIMRREAGRIDEERSYTAEDYERMLSDPS